MAKPKCYRTYKGRCFPNNKAWNLYWGTWMAIWEVVKIIAFTAITAVMVPLFIALFTNSAIESFNWILFFIILIPLIFLIIISVYFYRRAWGRFDDKLPKNLLK